MHNFGGDSFLVVGLILGNLIFFHQFARKSVPEKNLFTVLASAKTLAARDNLIDPNHICIIT